MRTSKYIESFLKLRAAPDLLPFFGRCAKASKEITESYACYEAAKKVLGLKYDDPGVTAIVVGDGGTPRTGALIAHLTKWSVLSIDPEFNVEATAKIFKDRADIGNPIRRLEWADRKAEDCVAIEGHPEKEFVIVLPHSHAPMDACIKMIASWKAIHIVSIPCCRPVPEHYLKQEMAIDGRLKIYRDPEILSDKNMVYTWRNYK